MMKRGFTIVELIITITIMGILLTLAVVSVNSTQLQARDAERKTDVESVQAYLESYYTTGLSAATSIPRITNLVTNPSLETNTTGWASFFTTMSRSSTQAKFGTYSLRSSSPGTDVHGVNYERTVTAGVTYTFSAWVYRPSTSQDVNFKILLAGAAYPNTQTTPATIPANTWTWLTLTATASASGTASFIVLTDQTTTSSGHIFYTDGAMITEGSTVYNYADGNSTNWTWDGTANLSTSTGLAVFSDGPGSYPSRSLASSGQIDVYLRDADLKSFTAPGQTDPYVTFVAATNATQTTAGVLPQPTINQYVYQPIDTAGALCGSTDCRKYNIYYRLEGDNTVHMVTSKNQ